MKDLTRIWVLHTAGGPDITIKEQRYTIKLNESTLTSQQASELCKLIDPTRYNYGYDSVTWEEEPEPGDFDSYFCEGMNDV